MKAENLYILKENGIRVPDFIVINGKEKIDMSFSKEDLFAVRSSFAEEDSTETSFAGQFETILNVKRNEILQAVRKVQDSVYADNVRYYKKELQKADKMQVIIQEMVQSQFSGVIFTSNPTGLLNEMVLVVGEGLGDRVVEDRVDTVTYYYHKEDGIFYSNQEGSLPEYLIKELFEQAKKIEQIFQTPMDIEFGIQDEVVYILQARPITNINYDNLIILDNSNIVESYPGISLPMTQSFVKEIYYKVFKSLVLRLTQDGKLVEGMDGLLQHMTDVANGRIYYRISNWYDVLNLLPFSKKIISIWQKMLGVSNTEVHFNIENISLKTKCKVCKSFVQLLYSVPRQMEELNTYFTKKLPIYRKQLEQAETIEQLLIFYKQIKEDLVTRWDITLANDMYAFLFTALAGKRNKDIANIKNLESMKPVHEIQKILRIVEQYGYHEEYEAAKKAYIDQYGDRCLNELKLETMTYRTNPELFDAYIRSQIITNIEEHQDAPSKNFFVQRAKCGIMNREISRMNRSRIFGIMRDILLKIGQIMVSQGQIEKQQDIFYLFMDEIADQREYIELVNQRKVEYQGYEKLPMYSRLVFMDHIVNKETSHVQSATLSNENQLLGIASSRGCVTGEVIVIDSARQDIDTTGKIIVTKTTDPGWVLLIKNSLGIIAENGSILSHTAIITRELKKPSIVNVKNATTILKTGNIVELDAYKGEVYLKQG